ncbi:MAG: hypothetical protein Q8O59_00315 [bacterium]|nr:hypothetical protein [bacterium]
MKKFKVGSCFLTETKKWSPCGTLFDLVDGGRVNVQEADVFPPEYRFNTKEGADNFFRENYLKEGYVESIDK